MMAHAPIRMNAEFVEVTVLPVARIPMHVILMQRRLAMMVAATIAVVQALDAAVKEQHGIGKHLNAM